MIHMTETMYACSLAASYEGVKTPSGVYSVNNLLANTSKLHEGRVLHEMCRLLQDIAGGLVATMPSEKDFKHPEIGAYMKKYLKGVASVPVESRRRMFRLIGKINPGKPGPAFRRPRRRPTRGPPPGDPQGRT